MTRLTNTEVRILSFATLIIGCLIAAVAGIGLMLESKPISHSSDVTQHTRVSKPNSKQSSPATIELSRILSSPSTSGWSSYHDKDNTFQFHYPPNWIIEEHGARVVVVSPNWKERPLEVQGDDFDSKFGIEVAPLNENPYTFTGISISDIYRHLVGHNISSQISMATSTNGNYMLITSNIDGYDSDAIAYVTNGWRAYQIAIGRPFIGENSDEDWLTFSGIVYSFTFLP